MASSISNTAPLLRESLDAGYFSGSSGVIDALSLSVSLDRLTDHASLEADWRSLESVAQGSFFTTWAWIGNWLATLPDDVELWTLTASRAGLKVGLGVLLRSRQRVARFWQCESWHLHASGRTELDVIYIEHNDFLVHGGDATNIRRAMLSHWAAHSGPRAVLHLAGVSAEVWGADSVGSTLVARSQVRACHSLDSTEYQPAPEDFTSLLRSHTRRLVRRSKKEYAKRGALQVHMARDQVEAIEWFEHLLRLNAVRLDAKGVQSDCQTAYFQQFHRKLLSQASANVFISKTSAGDELLGFVYGFVHRDRAYIYQCGFDFSGTDNHARPGYVSHCMTAELLAQQGVRVYDLMAGDMTYKTSLCNRTESLSWLSVHKHHLSFRIEDWITDVRKSALAEHVKRLIRR